MKNIRTLFTISAFLGAAALAGCVSTGSAETQLGDGSWEIRAWDGRACKSSTPRDQCDQALMPVIEDRAQFICGKDQEAEVDKCQRKDAASGDRLYCLARCKPKATKA